VADVPILETPRLTLRGHVATDFAESAAMWADPVVTRHIGGRAFTNEESWARLLRYPGLWSILGYGYWVVRERASGAFVGEVGFADFHRAIEPSLGAMPEGGWVLVPGAHGKGYATEALRAALAWLEGARGPERTCCLIAPENASSLRVAHKCGYAEAARTTYKESPAVILHRGSASPR
jgi:RimJ/RimL family protein N-acetyltransferase